LLIIKILGSTPMCTKPQKQEKKIIHSEIRNILNPVIILFWTRIVTLPSLDSWVKSLHQPLTPSSSSILAIINIVSLTILNHTAVRNRNADIPSREGHQLASGMKKGLEVDISQTKYSRYLREPQCSTTADLRFSILFALLRS